MFMIIYKKKPNPICRNMKILKKLKPKVSSFAHIHHTHPIISYDLEHVNPPGSLASNIDKIMKYYHHAN